MKIATMLYAPALAGAIMLAQAGQEPVPPSTNPNLQSIWTKAEWENWYAGGARLCSNNPFCPPVLVPKVPARVPQQQEKR